MTDDTRNQLDTVVEQARQAAGPALLEAVDGSEIAVFHTLDGVEIVDLGDDEYADRADRPRRKSGTTVVQDVASFVQYYGKHADTDSEVYANLDAGLITAVLDAHEINDPRWGCHRLILQLIATEPWKRWTSKDRRMMPQVEFAEFLEDNLTDLANDPVPAAEVLEVARTFQARTKVQFSSGIVQASGDIRLKYEETTDASGGARGELTVPHAFAVALAPFDDCDPYKVNARLRHRIEGGHLKLMFILDRPEDVIRDAVKTVVGQVEDACGITVMRGAPAA